MKFRRALILVFLLEIVVAVWAIVSYGWGIEGLQATTRFSGRLSLALFSILFLFSEKKSPVAETVLSDKPFAAFAVAHGIHLFELLSFVWLSGTQLVPYRIAGGFLAYAMIFAMPYIQQQYNAGQLTEKSFRKLHLIYIYYVWLIFFMSYLPRVMGKLPNVGGTYVEFVVLLAWVCLLLGMKVAQVLIPQKSIR